MSVEAWGATLNLEHPNEFVFQGKVVRGFRGNFDFSCGLRSQEWNQQKEE